VFLSFFLNLLNLLNLFKFLTYDFPDYPRANYRKIRIHPNDPPVIIAHCAGRIGIVAVKYRRYHKTCDISRDNAEHYFSLVEYRGDNYNYKPENK